MLFKGDSIVIIGFKLDNYIANISKFWFDKKGQNTVNVTGETLVPSKYFTSFILGKSLFYAGKIPIFPPFPALCYENICCIQGQTLFSQLFQLNAGKILALCQERNFV